MSFELWDVSRLRARRSSTPLAHHPLTTHSSQLKAQSPFLNIRFHPNVYAPTHLWTPNMRRHEMLLCFIAVAALACASPTSRSIVPTPTPSEDSAREQTADQQVRHVLNRLAFGPRPGD